MNIDIKFVIKSGDGQITFPIYRVPVSGSAVREEAADITNLQVALDRQVLEASQSGIDVVAAYSDVAVGKHQIVITGAIDNTAFAIVYGVRAEESGYPAEITAPSAYISLAPTGGGSIEDQIKDLQDRMTAAEGDIDNLQNDILVITQTYATKSELQATLGEIQAAIEALPDGQAVSATVAEHTLQIKELDEKKPDKTGNYPDMRVGLADNLTGDEIDVATGYVLKPLAYDPTRPELEVADGQVRLTEIRGRAVAWNQLVSKQTMAAMAAQYYDATYDQSANAITRTANGEYDGMIYNVKDMLITNHKYFCSQFDKVDSLPSGKLIVNVFCSINEYVTTTDWFKSSGIITYDGGNKLIGVRNGSTVQAEGFTMHVANIVLIDLTLLCGAGNEPTTVAGVEAYLASRRRLAPYYAYNAGQLLGARFKGWSMPRNLNLLNPATKQARLPEYAYTGHDNEFTVVGFDSLTNAALQFTPDKTGVAEAVTLDANNRFVIPSTGTFEVVADGGDITGDVASVCVLMTWDGSMDTEYQPFEEFVSDLDSANIYYDDNGTKKQAFDGGVLRAVNASLYDSLKPNIITKKWEANVNIGDVDLGTLSWQYVANDQRFASFGLSSLCKKPANDNTVPFIICSKYAVVAYSSLANSNVTINKSGSTSIKDSALSSSDIVSGKIAKLNGIIVNYALATPVTHTNLLYKTGEDTYAPLEDVLPIDGLQGYGCNWATESLTEMPEDAQGQPQAITPETLEVFQTDMKELLKTIGDTYISKEQAKDSFDNFFAVLNANSGTALGGTYATDGYNEDGSIKFAFTAAEPAPENAESEQ